MPDTINWEAKYLDQIETRLDELAAGQTRLEEKVDQQGKDLRNAVDQQGEDLRAEMRQQGKDLRAEIEKAVTPVNRLVWATLAAVLLGLVKTFFFSPHP